MASSMSTLRCSMLGQIWCGTQPVFSVRSARNSFRTSSTTLYMTQMASSAAVAMENCRPSGAMDVMRWVKVVYEQYILLTCQHTIVELIH